MKPGSSCSGRHGLSTTVGVALFLSMSLLAVAGTEGMRRIPAGVYRPLFRLPDEPREEAVAAFLLDEAPVTNAEFLEFVRANPRWRRSQVRRLFADPGYLGYWRDDLDPGSAEAVGRPVVQVSWFAAKAYAAWMGRRLPTTVEWERAAAAGFTLEEGARDPDHLRALLHWYSSPMPAALPSVRSGPPNLHGVHDLHGLVWEWTQDFNAALVTGDARGDTGIERQLFCGAGAQSALDRSDFPAFMRSGLRSSLKAAYTLPHLGFRCAADAPSAPPPSPSSPSKP